MTRTPKNEKKNLSSPQNFYQNNTFLSVNREINREKAVKKRERAMEIPKKASYILEPCPPKEHDPVGF